MCSSDLSPPADHGQGEGKTISLAPNKFDVISEAEMFWRDRYVWLQQRGYELRKRYHPDWVAPWLRSGLKRQRYEDNLEIGVSTLQSAG